MATTYTSDFNLDLNTLIEEAFERCGQELRTGYDFRTSRRSLNLLTVEWANRGINLWTVEQGQITLNQAYQYVSNQQRGVTETIDMYKDYAKAFGLNPEKAVPNPFADIKKPPSKTVMINKKQEVAKLADDGNYYIQSGVNTDGTPKYFKVD